jgi:hypothetical protein
LLLSIQSAPASAPATKPASAPCDRIVVIGASASAGFGLDGGTEGKPTLARAIDVMLHRAPGTTRDFSTEMFFLAPSTTARNTVEKALALEPTLVIGLDFLFWFGYGSMRNESERLTTMDEGLKLLELFSCPILIATLPDMSEAIGKMLAEAQVPKFETLEELNEKIESWVDDRPNAALVPLPELVAMVRLGLPVKVRGKELPGDFHVLQSDRLHPTVGGLAVLTELSMDALAKKKLTLPANLIWDPVQLEKDLRKSLTR